MKKKQKVQKEIPIFELFVDGYEAVAPLILAVILGAALVAGVFTGVREYTESQKYSVGSCFTNEYAYPAKAVRITENSGSYLSYGLIIADWNGYTYKEVVSVPLSEFKKFGLREVSCTGYSEKLFTGIEDRLRKLERENEKK